MCGITCAPIIACGSIAARLRASAIDVGTVVLPLIRNASGVLVGPIGWYVAIVILEIVDPPSSKSSSIEILVADLGWVTTTCLSASTTVYANLQTQGVDGICNTFDARGELRRVRDDLAGSIVAAGLYGPAVVDCAQLSKK